ncbi:26S proteasome regulatory subunit RPN1 [Mycena olivaceomarginata]|nr:26S proteasome regulatory subunit RPN1 [Mycena olivaceomarginata]
MVRIAQGLVHMGKGMIALDPFANRSIISLPVVAGLSAMLIALTDAKHFVLDKYRWMMYFFVTAMYPRFLITVDEQLNSMPVTMCIGQALDVVAPGATERMELVTKEFIPFGHVLEGFVKRALEILDLRIEIHDASTVCGKRVDHGDWE